MKEELLHFIWQSKTLFTQPLQTVDRIPVEVQNGGSLNTDAGPDFFNARIRIGNTLWAGNVEIHVASSDWIRHKHHHDRAYDNVILHVVYVHDTETGLPTLELKNILSPSLLAMYEKLRQSKKTIPCESVFSSPGEIHVTAWLQRLSVERLSQKCERINERLNRYEGNWERTFYVTLSAYFGMKTNALPFERLAATIPLHILGKHKHSLQQTEALLLGVAGFLPASSRHPYIGILNREYEMLQHKFGLPQMDKTVWKYARTRPANFPALRIAQMAWLIHRSSGLFSKLVDAPGIAEARKLLYVIPNERLPLNKLHEAKHDAGMAPGVQFIDVLLINAVIPVLFAYGKYQHHETLCEKVLDWMEHIRAEQNQVTRFWKKLRIVPVNAGESQGLTQLKTNYCDQLKCLKCSFGNHILLKTLS